MRKANWIGVGALVIISITISRVLLQNDHQPAVSPATLPVSQPTPSAKETAADRETAAPSVPIQSPQTDSAAIHLQESQVATNAQLDGDGEDKESALNTIHALALLGSPAAVDQIRDLIRNTPDGEWKHQLAESAACITNPAATAELFDCVLNGNDDALIELAQRSLAAMTGNAALFETVARYRLSTDEAARDALLGVIRYQSNPDAVTPLTQLADQSNGDYNNPLALAIVDTLGVIGTAQAVSNLALRIPSARETGPLANAISRITNPDAIPILLTLTSASYSPDVRLAAIRALGNFQSDQPVSALLALTNNTAEEAPIREEAARSLQRAGYITPNP